VVPGIEVADIATSGMEDPKTKMIFRTDVEKIVSSHEGKEATLFVGGHERAGSRRMDEQEKHVER
jgi:hypothetical protein